MITGKVLGSVLDENGNIKVKTEYTLTNGMKTIGHTRYNWLNFSREKVLQDVKAHCETLMRKVYGLKQHTELVKANLTDITYQCYNAVVITKPAIIDKDGNIVKKSEAITIDDK